MAYQVEPASSNHDAGVMELFEDSGIPIEPTYWERAYDANQPGDGPCKPYVLVKDEEDIVGFASLRPRTLSLRG